jgi:DNA-binding NarL/FixJ family response regulator
VLSAELHGRLSGVLAAASRDLDARALPVPDLISLSESLPSDGALMIDSGSAKKLGQPLVVLRVSSAPRSHRFDVLTPRERDVAACVGAGLPNREIATRLWLTTATVKDHVHRILTKTGLPNRTAVAAAWQSDMPVSESTASTTSA